MQLKVTDNAFKRVAELMKLEKKFDLALRISADGGGCSGFMYKYELIPISDISGDDYVSESEKERVKIVVDSLSGQFVAGCTVDFVEELGSSYFEIRNPNAVAKCGCGNSFSV